MPEVNTRELEGAALDWAVDSSEGNYQRYVNSRTMPDDTVLDYPRWASFSAWSPSRNWNQGGPIIEREHITLDYAPESTNGKWIAEIWPMTGAQSKWGRSDSPLVAAMRAYVHSQFGDTINIPQEVLDAGRK